MRSEAGGSRLCHARGTPKPGHLQPCLDKGKWDPFAEECSQFLGTASGIYNTLNPRRCRGQWGLPSSNVTVGDATFLVPQKPFPCFLLSTCGHALTLTQCNICCGPPLSASVVFRNAQAPHALPFFSLRTRPKAACACDL